MSGRLSLSLSLSLSSLSLSLSLSFLSLSLSLSLFSLLSLSLSLSLLSSLSLSLSTSLSSGIWPMTTQKVTLWWYFETSIFGLLTLKFSKGAFVTSVYFFEGERAPIKHDFLVKGVQKLPKYALFDRFFRNWPAMQNIWPKHQNKVFD